MPNTNPNLETPKREILVFYYKYRMRLVLAFFLPFLTAIVASFMPTPLYQATSTLVVRLGEEYVYQPEVGSSAGGQPSPIPFERDQIYKAEVAILGSHDLHQQVVQSVGLDRMYPAQKPGAFDMVTQQVRVALLSMLDRMFPEDAEGPIGHSTSILRAMLQDQDTDASSSPEEKAHRRLDKAVVRFDKNLKIDLEKESAVIDLTFEHKDRSVAVAALQSLLDSYMEKRKQIYQESRGSLAKEQAEVIHHRVTVLQASIESFKRQHKIYSLPDQRAQLLQQREDIRKQMMVISSPALEDKLNNVTEQLDALDALERQSTALDHDLQVANDEYTIYSHKQDEAQSYDSIERARAGSVRVIEQPSALPEPKKLQGLIILAGFVLSLIFTVLVAAFTEFSRSGFLTPERMERNLRLPILCALPLRKR